MKIRPFRHIIISVLAFCIVGVLALIALNISFLDPVAKMVEDFSFSDIYYQILQETDDSEEDGEITIVDMSELNRRRDLADVLEKILEKEPKVLGVDIVFEGLKDDSIGDERIWNAADNAGDAIFSYRLLDYENDSIGYTKSVHSFFAEPLNVKEGFTNMQRELYGGIKREISLGKRHHGELQPSFVTMLVNEYAGKEIYKAEDKDISIDYSPRRFQIVSPDSIDAYQSKINGHLVLFGATRDENDMHYTPIGKMSGVELQAYSIKTLQEHTNVRNLPIWLKAILSFLLVVLTQTVLAAYLERAGQIRNRFLRLLLSSAFTKGTLLFLWMIVLMWVSFIVFFKFNLNIGLGWALSSMAFLDLAQNFYNECIKTYGIE